MKQHQKNCCMKVFLCKMCHLSRVARDGSSVARSNFQIFMYACWKCSQKVHVCNLKIGSCRKPSETVGTEEINTKRQERELLFIFKFIVTILNNGSSLISSESSVSKSQQSLFFSAILAFIFLQTAKWRRM